MQSALLWSLLMPLARTRPLFPILFLAALSGTAHGQDSVPSTPGANDALSAYDTATLDRSYVVDLNAISSSWGKHLGTTKPSWASRSSAPPAGCTPD